MKRLTYEEAFEVMEKFHKVMEEAVKEMFASKNGYPLGHFAARLLFMMEHFKTSTIKDLKEWLDAKHGNCDKKEKSLMEVKIAKATSELVGFGLIELVPSEKDKRIKQVVITQKGIDYIKSFNQLAKEKWEAIKE